MRKLLGKVFSALLLFIFKERWIRSTIQKGEILSVFYHRPNPKEFEKWAVWCKENGFKFISTSELAEILRDRKPIKEKMIWLTFDDGWRNNYTDIIPILTRYRIPTTIFVSTNLIQEGVFWLELVRLNQHLIAVTPNQLKLYKENERIEFIKKLKEHPDFVQMDREFMTWEEIKQISLHPLIDIGNHTHNHVICTNCTLSQLEKEIMISESLIKENISKFLNAFAYPNGNYNDSTQEFIRKRFHYVVVVNGKNINKNVSLQEIPRICLGDNLSYQENIFNMFGNRSKIRSYYR